MTTTYTFRVVHPVSAIFWQTTYLQKVCFVLIFQSEARRSDLFESLGVNVDPKVKAVGRPCQHLGVSKNSEISFPQDHVEFNKLMVKIPVNSSLPDIKQ